MPMTTPIRFTLFQSRLRTMMAFMLALAGSKRMVSPSG